jgi:TonB family protein
LSPSVPVVEQQIKAEDLVGVWQNEDTLTSDITRVVVRPAANGLSFAVYDKAYPNDVSRGELTSAIPVNGGPIALHWTLPTKDESQNLRLLHDGRLKISANVHYLDNSGRVDREYDSYLKRISPLPPPEEVAKAPAPPDSPLETEEPKGPSTPPAERKPKPGSFVPSNDLDGPPTPVGTPAPVYTKEAIESQVKGTVALSLDINEKGEVTKAEVTSGPTPDYGMNAACQQAASLMTFSPPTKKGVPVKTTWTFMIALVPPPLPKSVEPEKATADLVIECKAHVQRFVVQIDGSVVFDSPMAGSMGHDVKEERKIQLPSGPHHFIASATFGSGRTVQTAWDQTFQPGQVSIFNVWVPTFGGSMKMKRWQ